MVNIKAFSGIENLKPFVCQKEQREEFNLDFLQNQNLMRFVMENENETLAIFWFWDLGEGRFSVGSFLSENCGPFFPEMRTLIEKLFDFYNAPRYEAIVKTNFENGHRMIKLLGFQREGTMRKFNKGFDFDLYARVK